MRNFSFVLLVSVISFSSCTADQEIVEEKKEKATLLATDPDDDGTFQPDPQETGNE